MQILIIDNSALKQNNSTVSCNKKTGEFAGELQEKGHIISWLQLVQPGIPPVGSFDITGHGMQVFAIVPRRLKIMTYIQVLLKGIKAIWKSDFVYMFYPSSFWFLLLICILLRKPFGLYIRGMVGIDSKRSQFIYRHACVVLTVSKAFTEKIKKAAPKTVVDTIRPMVDIDEKDLYNRSFSQIPSIFNVLFLARIDRDKGLQELLDAVKELTSYSLPPFALNIFGDGHDNEWLKGLIRQLGIEDKVKLCGAVKGKDNLLNVYRSADIYVLPTYHEGFPRTLYEAMISGVPIITTLVGGIPGLMHDGVNCIAIQPRSVESITEKLSYLLLHYQEVAPEIVSGAYKTVLPVIDSARPSHAQLLDTYICKQ